METGKNSALQHLFYAVHFCCLLKSKPSDSVGFGFAFKLLITQQTFKPLLRSGGLFAVNRLRFNFIVESYPTSNVTLTVFLLGTQLKQFGVGILNLCFLIYPLENFKSKSYPQIFFIFSLLEMPIVVDKSVSCELLLTKFTPKVGQVYPRLRTPHTEGKSRPVLMLYP